MVSVENNFQAGLGTHLVSVKSFEKISNFQWDDVIRIERKEKSGDGVELKSQV